MYRLIRLLRILITLLLVGLVLGAVAFYITSNNRERARNLYNVQATAAVETAVANALFNATRTAEAPLRQYRLIALNPGETITALAQRFGTTPAIIRQVNGLASGVETGNGEVIIVPEGVERLDPPRLLRAVTARAGDTLETIAESYNIDLDILKLDNPVLAGRGLLPGDTVFVAVLFS